STIDVGLSEGDGNRPRLRAGTIFFWSMTTAGRIAEFRPLLSHPLAMALLAVVAALVAAPVINLILIALQGDAELWPHLAAHVIPPGALNTILLLTGVAIICMVAGVGTAWTVTACEFAGRGLVLWLLPLPLAFPIYIVAYVYADLLGGLGPLQS